MEHLVSRQRSWSKKCLLKGWSRLGGGLLAGQGWVRCSQAYLSYRARAASSQRVSLPAKAAFILFIPPPGAVPVQLSAAARMPPACPDVWGALPRVASGLRGIAWDLRSSWVPWRRKLELNRKSNCLR